MNRRRLEAWVSLPFFVLYFAARPFVGRAARSRWRNAVKALVVADVLQAASQLL